MWINLAALWMLIAVYFAHRPVGGRNGATIYGYTLGGLATAGILYLMWYGIRKRSYHARVTSLRGCLSAHVWLGISLIVIVPLHSGFQFGINVHTFAYVVMVLVIVSGIWGARNYLTLTSEIPSNRGAGSLRARVEQIHLADQNIDALCVGKSDAFMSLRNEADFKFEARTPGLAQRLPDVARLGALLSALPSAEANDGASVLTLIKKKRDAAAELQRESKVLRSLRLWLYLHLPLSFLLLVALGVHIFVVFYLRG